MTEEIRNVYEQIVEKQEEVKKLESEIKGLKTRVAAYHGDQKMICEDGFQSIITHSTRRTLQQGLVESKIAGIAEAHGLELSDAEKSVDDCYKTVEYDSLKVSRTINENKEIHFTADVLF